MCLCVYACAIIQIFYVSIICFYCFFYNIHIIRILYTVSSLANRICFQSFCGYENTVQCLFCWRTLRTHTASFFLFASQFLLFYSGRFLSKKNKSWSKIIRQQHNRSISVAMASKLEEPKSCLSAEWVRICCMYIGIIFALNHYILYDI